MSWRSWLVRRLLAPEDNCAHDIDADASVRRLLATVQDPPRFAAELSTFAGCEVCVLSVTVQACYALAGFVIADSDDDAEAVEWVGCENHSHSLDVEALSYRALLSKDIDMLGNTIASAHCPTCLPLLTMQMVHWLQQTLDEAGPTNWQSQVHDTLLARLDGAGHDYD